MSVNYASGLSEYAHKGKVGMPEKFDAVKDVVEKAQTLSKWFQQSKYIVVTTGAGVSTAAGIPDFRGPNGVWTLEKKGEAPKCSTTFEAARPSFTHRALVALEQAGFIQFLISQNVDGLHVRSGFPMNKLSELHGNMFVEQCDKCSKKYVRALPLETMGLKPTGRGCTAQKVKGVCRGRLHDTILDWEDALPVDDLKKADRHSKQADLSLVLGSTLQIIPAGNLPCLALKNKGKMAIVNLQVTKHDKKASMLVNYYVDFVMEELCRELGVAVEEWKRPLALLSSVHSDKAEMKRMIKTVDISSMAVGEGEDVSQSGDYQRAEASSKRATEDEEGGLKEKKFKPNSDV